MLWIYNPHLTDFRFETSAANQSVMIPPLKSGLMSLNPLLFSQDAGKAASNARKGGCHPVPTRVFQSNGVSLIAA